MFRVDLVEKFRNHLASQKEAMWHGQRPLEQYLSWWLDEKVEFNDKYTGIVHYLPRLMVEALENLRTGQDSITQTFRIAYRAECEIEEFPDVKEVNGSFERTHLILNVSRIIEEVTENKWLEEHIVGYLRAQDYVLDQALREFNVRVYRQGLHKLTKENKTAGMSGNFGNTTLRTFYTAGRLMLTFARTSEKNPKYEDAVSFVADYDDPTGLRTGLQSVYCTFETAVSMIQEVTNNWPAEISEQSRIYHSDIKVGII